MASLETATKANSALVLPCLLVAGYLERTAILSSVSKTFQEARQVVDNESVKLSLQDGKAVVGKAIIQYLGNLANEQD